MDPQTRHVLSVGVQVNNSKHNREKHAPPPTNLYTLLYIRYDFAAPNSPAQPPPLVPPNFFFGTRSRLLLF